MALARAQSADPTYELYEQAKSKFLFAEEKWPGLASYNLACLHSMRGEEEECRKYLTSAQEHDELPTVEAIEADVDLSNMNKKEWFQTLLAEMSPAPAATSQ